MSEQIAFTRRQFMQGSLAVVSTLHSMPTFLNGAAHAAGPVGQSGTADDRVLVVVQLSGGNDGLNTVIPYGQGAYYDARPRLAIPEKKILQLNQDQEIGLHTKMTGMKELYDSGLLSIVQGVGYPNPNRSHFASMDVWHTGDTRGGHGVGWIGAALDEDLTKRQIQAQATTCISIGQTAPLATHGKKVKAIAFESAELFRWAGQDIHPALGPAYDQINRRGELAPEVTLEVSGGISGGVTGGQAAFVMRTALHGQVASDRIRAAVQAGPQTRFPNGSLADQLKMVAAMIRAGLPTRVYYVALGGFDTHAGQEFPHGNNLRLFSEAMLAFQKELKAIGHDERVLTMAFSEFGRRVGQNASNGTDHGCAGPMFLVGPMVKPGIHGKQPSLTKLDQGDLIYHTDFRSVYAAVLDRWMKINSAKALNGKTYRHANVIRANV